MSESGSGGISRRSMKRLRKQGKRVRKRRRKRGRKLRILKNDSVLSR